MTRGFEMLAVLGGGLEYALIRQITQEHAPTRSNTEHQYYRSLQRRQPDRMFDRAATILSISDRSIRPSVDWVPEMGSAGGPTDTDLGWFGDMTQNMWEPEWKAYVESAYDAHAFSAQSLEVLHGVDAILNPDKPETLKEFGVHHLMRLLLQLELAKREGASLFMPERDRLILGELSSFATRIGGNPPFELPDLGRCAIDPNGREVDLLVFHPHDVLSIRAVRKDKLVRRYAEAVSRLWQVQDPIERERGAVHAMRDLVTAEDFSRPIDRVFRTSSWILKPLAWIGVPGAAAAGDVLDITDQGIETRQKRRDWLLIQPRMSDLSLRDYLRRKDNY